MRRSIPSRILNPLGKPAAYYFFEGGARRWTDTIPLWYFSGASDTQTLLQSYTWKQMMSTGRFLFANLPMVRGGLLEQCNWSFPLEPEYVGADQDFGDKACEWLYQWDQRCNIRGIPFDAEACSRIRTLGMKVDGDICTIFTEDPDTEYPKIQIVRAHRVGDRVGQNGGILDSGPYKGQQVNNGFIVDRAGRLIAIQVLGQRPEDDDYIEIDSAHPQFQPDYSDQARGISHLVASINSFQDLKRLNEYEMRAQELISSIGLIEKNEMGVADEAQYAITRPTDSDPTATGGTAAGLVTETYEGGLIRYFRSGSGSGLESFRGDRPSQDAAAFEARIVRYAFHGIEWDPDFALSLKEPGGAWARVILQKVNRAIYRNQIAEAKVLYWSHVRALARAVYDLKILPPPRDGDIFSWNYKGPPKITADSGNDASAKRQDYILGTTTLSELSLERGKWWMELRAQKSREVRDLITRAKALLEEFPELGDLRTAMKLIEDPSPNQASPSGAGKSGGNEGDQENGGRPSGPPGGDNENED